MSRMLGLTFRTALPVAAFFAAFLLAPDTRPAYPEEEHGRSGAMQALEFWAGARTYPSGNISPDGYARAFGWARAAALKQKPLPFAGSGWRYIGPSNLSGRMLAIAVNPQNPNTIYAGSASGGLWRSYTGGVAGDWERVVTGHPVLGVAAIAIDPADSNVIYIGTGEVYRYAGTAGGLVVRTTRGSYGMGILKTTDGGSSWTKSLDWSYHQERGVQAIRVNPINPASVWAATTEGIYKSTNGGAAWENIFPILMAEDIVLNPADTLRVLVSTGNLGVSNNVLRTVDGGASWSLAAPTDFSGKTMLAEYASNPEVVYASVADSTTGVGSLWRSDDFGGSWTMLSDYTTNPIFQVQGWYSHFVAVHPLDPTIVIHAGVPASRSTNGGVTFTGVGGSYSDHHAYAWDPLNPSILYVANDDGIYRSTNAGASFDHVSENLGTGQFYNGFSNSASDSTIALGQVQDHIPGYLYAGSAAWPSSAADEVGWTAIDQTNDYVMYAGLRDGGALRKSTNRGASFGPTGGGFSGLSCWNTPFVLSPSNPNVLYFGRSRIFKSTNAAASWAATNGGAELDGNPALSMAVSPSNPDYVYVGTAPLVGRTHLFATTNGGTNWANVTGPLPDRYPLDIAVDPADPAVAYVGYGGYGSGHVFRTADGGGTWTDVTGALPDIPVTALLVDPANSAVVYLGSDIGVFISTNGGGSWQSFSDGLPEAILVSDLTMTPSNRTLRASTHGNSVFERKMPSSLPSLSSVAPSGGESWQVGSAQTISWNQALVSSVKLEYSTDDGSTWATIAASVPAWPDSFAWTVPPALTTAGRVRVSSTADTLLRAQSAAPFTIGFNGAIVGLGEGWNLVSVPVLAADPSMSALFPGAVGKAYLFDAGYLPADTLVAGRGYWVKLPAPGLSAIGGDSLSGDTVALSKGWNLIGSLTAPFPAAWITTDPPGLPATPFYAYDGSYSAVDTIRPGRGYWVKAGGAGSLFLSTGGAPAPGSDPRADFAGSSASRDAARSAGTIALTDARGGSALLYVTQGAGLPPEAFELPPVPPGDAFDVRFAGGSLLTAVDDSEHPLFARGVAYPAIVSWKIPDGEAYLLSAGPAGTFDVRGSGSVEIPAAAPLTLRRSGPAGEGAPGAFELRQNYPNPFNPSTIIRFTIPGGAANAGSAVPVSVRIYDVTGRIAGALASGGMAPGGHELEWNAGDLPGGVYFCVVKAGSQSQSIKMLLLR